MNLQERVKHFEIFIKNHFIDNPSFLSEKITSFWEETLRELFNRHFPHKKGILLLAAGGFGRRDMNLYSDPDITFIVEREFTKELELFFYELWDQDIQVSHSTRNIEETERVMEEDIRTRFSLFEGRYLAGDEKLYTSFQNIVKKRIYSKEMEILKNIERMRLNRLKKYRNTVYFIEPNIKEGPGGLRDIHSLLWCIKVAFRKEGLDEGVRVGIITGREKRDINRRWNFLKRLRNILHYLHGRKYDILDFESQDSISKILPFKKEEDAAETLMRKYYEITSWIKDMTDYVIKEIMNIKLGSKEKVIMIELNNFYRKCEDRLTIKNEKLFEEESWRTLEAFRLSMETNLQVGDSVKRIIRKLTMKKKLSSLLKNQRAREEFLKIMKNENAWFALTQMNEAGLLPSLIPPFKHIRHKVQRDMFHIYTVDVHSIFAIREFGELRKGHLEDTLPLPTELARNCPEPEIISLALLFHDIGKWGRGEHSERGAKIVKRFLSSIGFKEKSKEIQKIVELHNTFTETPFKRDIRDRTLVMDYAREIGSVDILNALFIHGICDMRAVNPEGWSHWKYSNMLEFYERIKEALTIGDFYIFTQKRKIIEIKKAVKEMVSNHKHLIELLEGFDKEYFLSFSPDEIVKHLKLIAAGEQKGYGYMKKDFPEKGYSEITITAKNEHGIFSRLCGALTKSGLNILSALVFSRKDGKILDVFNVTEKGTLSFPQFFEWNKLWKNLDTVLSTKTDIGVIDEEPGKGPIKERVIINNNISSKYTVLEVNTNDSPGLLYKLTSSLSKLGCEIYTAKVLTLGKLVSDVFYITDGKGNKITDKNKLTEITNRIISTLRSSG